MWGWWGGVAEGCRGRKGGGGEEGRGGGGGSAPGLPVEGEGGVRGVRQWDGG